MRLIPSTLCRAAPLVLLLAACQPMTYPFGENHPPPLSPIMSPPDAAGIVVRPVIGAPASAAAALAGAMSDALLQEDVPADTDAANRRSYHLAGVVSTEADGDRIRVAIDWRLVGADGRSVATESEREEVPEAAWAKGDAEMAKALVAKAALRLAKRVEGDAPQEHAVNAPVVAVAPVTGASGDGGHALSLAMTDALRRGGLALKDNQDDPANFLLTGRVAIGTPTAGHQQIKIVWILSGAKGQEIGRVSQENAVPAGSLDGAWGDTAYDVATAAATGIVSLIQRAQGAPAGG